MLTSYKKYSVSFNLWYLSLQSDNDLLSLWLNILVTWIVVFKSKISQLWFGWQIIWSPKLHRVNCTLWYFWVFLKKKVVLCSISGSHYYDKNRTMENSLVKFNGITDNSVCYQSPHNLVYKLKCRESLSKMILRDLFQWFTLDYSSEKKIFKTLSSKNITISENVICLCFSNAHCGLSTFLCIFFI